MNDLLILEILVRGCAVGAFVGLALVMARPPYSPARITGVLFSLGAVGHTLTQHPLIAQSFGYALLPFWMFSVMGAGLFWAFANELFEDRPRLQPIRLGPAFALLVVGIGVALTGGGIRSALLLVHNVLGAALMAHVLLVIWNGWRNDLVESRRRLRGPILGAAALYAVVIIAVQIAEVLLGPASALSPLAAIALLILGLAGIGALLQVDADLFAVARPESQAAKAAPVEPIAEDGKLADKLEDLMLRERAYRDEQLSIGALALRSVFQNIACAGSSTSSSAIAISIPISTNGGSPTPSRRWPTRRSAACRFLRSRSTPAFNRSARLTAHSRPTPS